MTSLPPF